MTYELLLPLLAAPCLFLVGCSQSHKDDASIPTTDGTVPDAIVPADSAPIDADTPQQLQCLSPDLISAITRAVNAARSSGGTCTTDDECRLLPMDSFRCPTDDTLIQTCAQPYSALNPDDYLPHLHANLAAVCDRISDGPCTLHLADCVAIEPFCDMGSCSARLP